MDSIAFLIADTESIEDGNYLRLGNELLQRGFGVAVCLIDSISMHDSNIRVKGFTLNRAMNDGDSIPALESFDLSIFSHLWLLSLGFRRTFLDKMQLLYSISDRVHIINSLDTITHLNSKYFLATRPGQFKYPATYASTDPEELYQIMQQGGMWIAKPPAGSLGREVFLISHEDANARVILETLCGPDKDQFTLLQAYIQGVEKGEKRVLLAGGKPIGQYRRIAKNDHRNNLHQGASSEMCELTAQETRYCIALGAFLKDFGAEFVGLDLVYPWIIEFNVINPGGLVTIAELGGQDLTATIIDEIGFTHS
jgi:glutathione synthase